MSVDKLVSPINDLIEVGEELEMDDFEKDETVPSAAETSRV